MKDCINEGVLFGPCKGQGQALGNNSKQTIKTIFQISPRPNDKLEIRFKENITPELLLGSKMDQNGLEPVKTELTAIAQQTELSNPILATVRSHKLKRKYTQYEFTI